MTRQEKERVAWHLQVPVCETKRGCKVHLRLASNEDIWLLCRYLQCDATEIETYFWLASQNRKAILRWMADDMDDYVPRVAGGLW